MAMTVRYRARRGEIWAAYGRAWRQRLWKFHLALAVMITLFMLSGGGVPDSPGRWALLIAIPWVIPLLLPLYPQLRFKPEERVLTLAAEGIVTTIGKRSGTIPWSTVRNVRDEGAVMIERLNGNAFAVPARAFATIEERRAFIAFATSAAANA